MAQSQICRTMHDRVHADCRDSAAGTFGNRRTLGQRICWEFFISNAIGGPQISGCLKALSVLAGDNAKTVLQPQAAVSVDQSPLQLQYGVRSRSAEQRELPTPSTEVPAPVVALLSISIHGRSAWPVLGNLQREPLPRYVLPENATGTSSQTT